LPPPAAHGADESERGGEGEREKRAGAEKREQRKEKSRGGEGEREKRAERREKRAAKGKVSRKKREEEKMEETEREAAQDGNAHHSPADKESEGQSKRSTRAHTDETVLGGCCGWCCEKNRKKGDDADGLA